VRRAGDSTKVPTHERVAPHTQSPGLRGIGERPARDQAEGAPPHLPPRLGLIRNPPVSGGSASVPPGTEPREPHNPKTPPRLGLRRSPVPRKAGDSVRRAGDSTEVPTHERVAQTRTPPVSGGSASVPPGTQPRGPSVATPSARPSALAGPPQSGRQRKKRAGDSTEVPTHERVAQTRNPPVPGGSASVPPGTQPRGPSAATPSARPSALAGPPQSGRRRERASRQGTELRGGSWACQAPAWTTCPHRSPAASRPGMPFELCFQS